MPPISKGHMREGGVTLLPGYNPPYANPYTSDIYTPGAGPNTMPSMHQGHMQMGGGVLPFSMPALTPGQIPVKINQHATTMTNPGAPYHQPAMANGGFTETPGYHWDGERMVKSKGGTYTDGVYYQQGGPYTTLLEPDANNSYGKYATQRVPQWTDQYAENIEEYKYGGQHVAIDYDGHLGDVAHYENGGPVNDQDDDDIPEFAKGGIHIKKSHIGKFTAYKKRTGKTTEQAMHSKDPHVKAMAVFAHNAAGWRKKQYGGSSNPFAPNYMQDGGSAWGPATPSPDIVPPTPTPTPPPAENPDPDADARNQKYNSDLPPVSPDSPTTDPATNLDAPAGTLGDQYTPPQRGNQWGKALNGFDNALAGTMGFLGALNSRHQERDAQRANYASTSSNGPIYTNTGGHGNYNPNSGAFRQDQMTPSQSPQMHYSQYGGKMQQGGYVKGQECELSQKECDALIRAGYKIEKI